MWGKMCVQWKGQQRGQHMGCRAKSDEPQRYTDWNGSIQMHVKRAELALRRPLVHHLYQIQEISLCVPKMSYSTEDRSQKEVDSDSVINDLEWLLS